MESKKIGSDAVQSGGRVANRVAVVIRCGGNGGRCRRQIGEALTNPGRRPQGAILRLSNRGWLLDHGYPLLEDRVPADFSGSTGILGCPDHRKLITERSDEPPPFPGLPRGSWVEGISVQMPLLLLKEPYERFMRSGNVQELRWMPGAHPTILTDGDILGLTEK